MDGDGEPEVLTIVTNPALGGGVWLWQQDGNVRARSDFHGLSNRWLNPLLGSADVDGDGRQEIAVIRTPHIGGVLQVLSERQGRLVPLHVWSGLRSRGVSNHIYGDPNIHTALFCQFADGTAGAYIQRTIDRPVQLIRVAPTGIIEDVEQVGDGPLFQLQIKTS